MPPFDEAATRVEPVDASVAAAARERLDRLRKLAPLLGLDLPFGEGMGAVLPLPVRPAAAKLLPEMATSSRQASTKCAPDTAARGRGVSP